MNDGSTPDLRQLLGEIEFTYEFMLAYASQVTASQVTASQVTASQGTDSQGTASVETASQGTGSQGSTEAVDDSEIRSQLEKLDRNLNLLDQACSSLNAKAPDDDEDDQSIDSLNCARSKFVMLLLSDKQRAQAAVQLVLASSPISSQLVDNLNASMHLRALLTDLFLLDEATRQD